METWEKPLPLIIPDENGRLHLNTDVIDTLSKIDKPLCIVSITGEYRSGKSFLLNRLAEKTSGFSVGETTQPETKGIWVWYIKHTLDDSKGLLLLDTEGLGDAEKDDIPYDNRILCLSLLLSSLFIYNCKGEINSQMTNNLKFVTEISKTIVEKTSGVGLDFSVIFPTFVLVLRDSFLIPKINDKIVSVDECMEHKMFTLKKDASSAKNDLIAKFRNYFPNRKCFALTMPLKDFAKVGQAENLTTDEYSDKFINQINEFQKYIFENTPVKKIRQIDNVNGKRFIDLVGIYIQQVQTTSTFCIDAAFDDITKRENQFALDKSIQLYHSAMKDILPSDTSVTDLLNAHGKCSKLAIECYLKNSIPDDCNICYKLIQDKLREEYLTLLKNTVNKTESYDESLAEFFEGLQIKLKDTQDFTETRQIFEKELLDCMDDTLKHEICKKLDAIEEQQSKLEQIYEENIKLFQETREKRQTTKQELQTNFLALKNSELLRLTEEGFQNSPYFRLIVQQIENYPKMTFVIGGALAVGGLVLMSTEAYKEIGEICFGAGCGTVATLLSKVLPRDILNTCKKIIKND